MWRLSFNLVSFFFNHIFSTSTLRVTGHTFFCYPKSLVLFLNASFENQLASLMDSITEVKRLVLSCLCNNNTIIVFTRSSTPPIPPLAHCSFNRCLIPLLWPSLLAMRDDSKLERSYHSLINKTQLLAWLVFRNQWGRQHLKWISPWGHGERL